MFRLYSKGCEYAIRALVDLAARGPGTNATVRSLCRRARLPEPSTRKMLQALAKRGILRSITGPRGGYQLARRPAAINILEVIQAVDGPDTLAGCVLGLPACYDHAPCALHGAWKKTRHVLVPALERLTLEDIRHAGNVGVTPGEAG